MDTIHKQTRQVTTSNYGDYFLKMSIDLLLIIDYDGRIIFMNYPVWSNMSGYTEQELIDMTPWDLVHQEDLPKAKIELESIALGNKPSSDIEVRMVAKNKSINYIFFKANVDRVKGLIYGIGRDITNRKTATISILESEEKFKFLSEHAFEGVCIHCDEILIVVNRAFVEMFGFIHEDELIGKHIDEFIAENEFVRVKNLTAQKFQGFYETKCKKINGDYFPVEINTKLIQYKGKQARIIAVRNIEDKKNALEKIQFTESRFKSVFESNSVGILLTNLQRKIIDANEYLLQRLEYTKDEILNMTLCEVIDKSELDETKQLFSNLIEGNIEKILLERKFLTKSKKIAWSRLSSSLISIENDEKLILCFIEDIEIQKIKEEALFVIQEKFRSVYETSPMGIFITKYPGILIDANPAFAEMIGYQLQDILQKNILDFTYSSDIHKSEKWMNKLYHNEINTYHLEKRYKKKDGSLIWAKDVVARMHVMSDDLLMITIIENIDRKKKTEQTLELRNKELELINQELEHFAYVASHDLQEPLRTITSFIQILEKKYAPSFDADGIQFLKFVIEGAKRMQTLIRDLLEYSRINRFNTSYEPVDLNEVFTTVNRVLKEKIDNNEAVILTEQLPIVQGNKLLLTQIFQNLIDNAIKFRGQKNPEIRIWVKELPDFWQFSFQDNGIGINAEYYQRIFVIFQRLHTHEEYTGTGIGLSICKKIIERHGGTISVESKVNKGTIFTFTLAKNINAPVLTTV